MITVSLAEAAARLAELVEQCTQANEPIEITIDGTWVAVLVSADHFDSKEETLEILGDTELMKDLAIAEEELRRGEFYTMEEVETEMRALGRWPCKDERIS